MFHLLVPIVILAGVQVAMSVGMGVTVGMGVDNITM